MNAEKPDGAFAHDLARLDLVPDAGEKGQPSEGEVGPLPVERALAFELRQRNLKRPSSGDAPIGGAAKSPKFFQWSHPPRLELNGMAGPRKCRSIADSSANGSSRSLHCGWCGSHGGCAN
jgi:hypothetical protein